MATITKTPSGTWKVLIRKTGWPASIKTFRTKRDAEDWGRLLEDEMVRGAFIQRAAGDRMTVAAALERYLAEVVPTKRPTSQVADRKRAKVLTEHLGKYSLAALTPEVIAKFRDARLAGEDRNRRLSQQEETKLLAAVDAYTNPMMSWIVRIALETGMRFSEIVTLRRMQVDLNRKIVRLLHTENTQPRTVPLSSAATELFHAALNNPVWPIDTDLIFFGEPGRDGKRRPYAPNRMWQKIKRDHGIVDLHFHDLRHEAVSRFVEAGFSDQEVSAISGHKSMQMLKRYTHLRAEDLVEKLEHLPSRKGR
jgi:integrase